MLSYSNVIAGRLSWDGLVVPQIEDGFSAQPREKQTNEM
jgi:hypothetical protein